LLNFLLSFYRETISVLKDVVYLMVIGIPTLCIMMIICTIMLMKFAMVRVCAAAQRLCASLPGFFEWVFNEYAEPAFELLLLIVLDIPVACIHMTIELARFARYCICTALFPFRAVGNHVYAYLTGKGNTPP
jgi:hypothetical protein